MGGEGRIELLKSAKCADLIPFARCMVSEPRKALALFLGCEDAGVDNCFDRGSTVRLGGRLVVWNRRCGLWDVDWDDGARELLVGASEAEPRLDTGDEDGMRPELCGDLGVGEFRGIGGAEEFLDLACARLTEAADVCCHWMGL